MRKHVTKRIIAIALCFCFVLSQMNLPSGLIKIDFGKSVINAKAADLTEQIQILSVSESGGAGSTVLKTVKFYFDFIDGKNVALTGVDSTAFENGTEHFAIVIPEHVGNGDGTGDCTVTSIGAVQNGKATDGLHGLTMLEYVSIPKSVTTIADNAFQGDTLLHIVDFEEGSKLSYIGNDAFSFMLAGSSSSSSNSGTKDMVIELPSSIQTIGDRAFYKNKNLKGIVVTDGVSSGLEVGTSAFESSNIEFAVLPNETKSMGEACFKDCTSLKGANIPTALANIPKDFLNGANTWCSGDAANIKKAIEDCAGQTFKCDPTPVVFSSAVETIGDSAFTTTKIIGADFSSAKKIQEIPDNAFNNCTELTGVNLCNDTIHTLGASAFEGCRKLKGGLTDNKLVFPETLKTIGANCFNRDSAIKDFNLGEVGVTEIGEKAFAGILVSGITFPLGLETIPASVCEGCVNIGRVNIPVTVKTIGLKAFYGCNGLTDIKYYSFDASNGVSEPNGKSEAGGYAVESRITKIGANAFNSANLTEFRMPAGLEVLEAGVLKGCGLGGLKDSETGKIKSVYFNKKITTIEDSAFELCTALKDITIPDTVISMGTGVFKGCSSLQNVEIQSTEFNKTTNGFLGASSFEGCSKLEQVTLSKAVKNIGEKAFLDCPLLEYIDMPGFSNMATIGDSSFSGCSAFAAFSKANYEDASTKGRIKFPSTLTAIGKEAFKGCEQLIAIDMGSASISEVKEDTFNGTSLISVVFSPNTKTVLGGSFKGCDLGFIEFTNPEIGSPIPSGHIAPTAFKTLNPDRQTYTYHISTSTVNIKVPANLLASYQTYFANTLGFTTLKESQFEVGVERLTTSVKLNNTTLRLGVGDNTFTLVATQDKGSSESIEFSSSNNKIVKVDQSGKLKAIRIGEATITAKTSKSGKTATCLVTVIAGKNAVNIVRTPITEIKFDATAIGTAQGTDEKLFPGDSRVVGFAAVESPSKDGVDTDPDAYDDEIALSIDAIDNRDTAHYGVKQSDGTLKASNGFIEAVCDPIAKTVTVKVLKYTPSTMRVVCSSSMATQSFSVTTKQLVAKITTREEKVATEGKVLNYRENATESVKGWIACEPSNHDETLSFASSNPKVATIDADGTLHHVGYGTTNITVTTHKSKKSFTFPVTLSLDSLMLEKTNYTLYAKGKNRTAQLVISTKLPAGIPVTYKSSNTKCATVSSTGLVTANAAGEAVVTVSVLGKNVDVRITIPKSIITVTLPGTTYKKKIYSISKKMKKIQLAYSATYVSSDKKPTVKYKSSKKSVATISKKGLIKLKKKGKTKITITVDGYSKTVTLNVKK